MDVQTSAMQAVGGPRRAWAPDRDRYRWGSDSGRRVLDELARWSGGDGARRRALAAVAGCLVAGRGWERLGFARLRDYAAERAGVSARQLQELARVDAGLAALPTVEAALVAGELSWTQARLLCRVATPRDERAWCAVAARLGARELAREVRRVDARAVERSGGADSPGAGGGADGEDWETLQLRCSSGVRGRWLLACRVAERGGGEALPRWACAEAVAAEALAAVGLPAETPEAQGPPTPEATRWPSAAAEAGVPTESAGEAPASVLPRSAGPPREVRGAERSGSDVPADPFDLDARLRRGLRDEQRRLARMGPLLLQVASDRLYRGLGYRGFDAYVRDELGLAPSTARALLRLERLAPAAPAFASAWRRGRVTLSQASALAPLLALEHSRPWHRAWLARASRVTVRRLKDDVDDAISRGELDPACLTDLPAGLRTGATPTRSRERVRLRIPAPASVARLFRAVVANVQRRIEQRSGRTSSEGEAFEAMLEHALESWGLHRPLARKFAVFERDGWRCTVPGCTSYRNLQDHHVRFRSAGGGDALENRTTLCAFHHLRGVHGGRLRCVGRAPEGLRFELGLRPGAEPLMRFGAGDVVIDAAPA